MVEFEARFATDNNMTLLKDQLQNAGVAALFNRLLHGYSVRSGSGGLHMFLRVSDGPNLGNVKIARRPATVDELAENPDDPYKTLINRGEGGFVVAAPSHGRVHRSGGAWRIHKGDPTTIATLTCDDRDRLYAVFATFDEQVDPPRPPPAKSSKRTAPKVWRNAQPRWRVVDGRRRRPHRRHGAVRSVLERHGWQHAYNDSHGRQLMRRPGKDGPGVSGSVNGTGRFVNFSTSAPFEAYQGNLNTRPTSHDSLDVIAVYEYGGDRTAAAKAIAERTGIYKQSQREQNDLNRLVVPQSAPPHVDSETGEIATEDAPNGKP